MGNCVTCVCAPLGCWDSEWRLIHFAECAKELIDDSVHLEEDFETRFEAALGEVVDRYFDQETDADVQRVLDKFPLCHQNAFVRSQAQHPTTTAGLVKLKESLSALATAHRLCSDLSGRLTETTEALERAEEASLEEDVVVAKAQEAVNAVEPELPPFEPAGQGAIDPGALAYSSGVRKGVTKAERVAQAERAQATAKREKHRRSMSVALRQNDAAQARAYKEGLEEHAKGVSADHEAALAHWETSKKGLLQEGLVAFLEPYLAIREAQTAALRQVLKASEAIEPHKNMVTQQAAGGGKRVKKALPPAAASMAGVPSGDASEVEKAPPSPSDSAADSSPEPSKTLK